MLSDADVEVQVQEEGATSSAEGVMVASAEIPVQVQSAHEVREFMMEWMNSEAGTMYENLEDLKTWFTNELVEKTLEPRDEDNNKFVPTLNDELFDVVLKKYDPTQVDELSNGWNTFITTHAREKDFLVSLKGMIPSDSTILHQSVRVRLAQLERLAQSVSEGDEEPHATRTISRLPLDEE